MLGGHRSTVNGSCASAVLAMLRSVRIAAANPSRAPALHSGSISRLLKRTATNLQPPRSTAQMEATSGSQTRRPDPTGTATWATSLIVLRVVSGRHPWHLPLTTHGVRP